MTTNVQSDGGQTTKILNTTPPCAAPPTCTSITPPCAPDVPEGLYDLLKGVTVAVLRDRPSDLYSFVADYFSKARDAHRAQTVPMYVVVTDDRLAGEPDPASIRCKTSNRRQQQIRAGRRGSVSAERYDPEKDLLHGVNDNDEEGAEAGGGTGADGTSGRRRATSGSTQSHPKSAEERQRLTEAVRDILLFRALDADVMDDVIDAMFERRAGPGEYVIRQGDDGDNFYVIESGVYDVIIDSGTGEQRKSSRVLQFDGRGSFGELALMYNQPRAASVVAVTDGRLWAMDRHSFRRLVLQSAFRKRRMYDRLLRSVPMLDDLDDYERATLADALRSQTYADGERVVAEGDEQANGMYFIERGAARVTITKDGRETEVSRLTQGDYFGEMALLENVPRTASVYAVASTPDETPGEVNGTAAAAAAADPSSAPAVAAAPPTVVRVAFLERESFERLLGPCLDVLKRKTQSYQKSTP